MTDNLVKTDDLSIQEAKMRFMSLPETQAILEIKKTADELIKNIDIISKHQDETTKSVLSAYKSQLKLCQDLSKDESLPAEQREKYFDKSMQITLYIRELKQGDDRRKNQDKLVNIIVFGIPIALSAPFAIKIIKDCLKGFWKK